MEQPRAAGTAGDAQDVQRVRVERERCVGIVAHQLQTHRTLGAPRLEVEREVEVHVPDADAVGLGVGMLVHGNRRSAGEPQGGTLAGGHERAAQGQREERAEQRHGAQNRVCAVWCKPSKAARGAR
jgi:hypothetical protein